MIEAEINLQNVDSAALEVLGAIAHHKRDAMPGFYLKLAEGVADELRRRRGQDDTVPQLIWLEHGLERIVELGTEAARFQVAAHKAARDRLPPGDEVWAGVAAVLDDVVAAFAAAEIAEREGLVPCSATRH